jgi:hypothetical protein
MAEAAYVSAAALVLEAFEGLLPPERLDVPTHAERKRWMNNTGGGHVGRFSHDLAPYTVAPSRCLNQLVYLTTAIVGPGQVAKTVIAENWLSHTVDTDPANFLWYMQTDEGLESYVKGRINPLIEDHDFLREKLGPRPVDNSLHFKRFRGMSAEFLAFGARTIINKSAPRIVADEVDNYQWLGDVKAVLDIRRQTFGDQSMLLAMSHPDLATGLDPAKDWVRGIMAFYADSTRFTWWWECPHCGAFSSPNPNAARVMTLEYPSDPDVPLDVVEREAHLLCPVNGCIVEDHHRKAMNLKAFGQPGTFDGWIGDGQAMSEDGTVTGELVVRKTAGFWIVGAMSPFVLGGIGGLARERVKAERARRSPATTRISARSSSSSGASPIRRAGRSAASRPRTWWSAASRASSSARSRTACASWCWWSTSSGGASTGWSAASASAARVGSLTAAAWRSIRPAAARSTRPRRRRTGTFSSASSSAPIRWPTAPAGS